VEVSFRKLNVYQVALRFLPMAQEIAARLPTPHACRPVEARLAVDLNQVNQANELLLPIVRMLSKMCLS
jgi:hypothetical protein